MRPVLIRFPALGDTVLLTTLIQALSQRHGQPVDLLASGDWVRPLLAAHTDVGDIHLVSSRRAPYWLTPSQWGAVRWLSERRGAPVYDAERDPHARHLLERAGIPDAHVLRAWDHPPAATQHWCDWWQDVAARSPAGLPGPAVPPWPPALTSLHLSPHDAAQAEAWLSRQPWKDRRLVLLQAGHKKTAKRGQIGTRHHAKHWPASRWAACAREILETDLRVQLLLCGSPREHRLVEQIRLALPAPLRERCTNLSRELPLPRLMVLARQASRMLSVDTGPAHVAAAMDCPMLVLFGGFGIQRWKPRAPRSQVMALGPAHDGEGRLEDLSVEEVMAAWHQLAERAPAGCASSASRSGVAVDLRVSAHADTCV